MKNKFVLILLITSLSLAGCGANNQTATDAPQSSGAPETETVADSTEENVADINSLGDVEVEKELFDVNITVPADFVGEATQEELDKVAEEKGFQSITLNEDGSATYVMTKSQHKKLMEETATNINDQLQEMVGSEDYPNFTDIKANSDFTEFTVTTTSTELDLTESFSVMAFYMYGGMYAIFNGETVDNIHVDFINADTGNIISSSDSSDMASTENTTE